MQGGKFEQQLRLFTVAGGIGQVFFAGSCTKKELHQFTPAYFFIFLLILKNPLYLHVHFLNDNAIIYMI
jgi:hypothetical protein